MNKKIVKTVLMTVLLSVGGLISFAQLAVLEKPTANLTEKWDVDSSGWVTNDSSCGWTNGSLAIKCPLLIVGDGITKILMLSAPRGASGNIFQGDYSKIEAVSFHVQPYDLVDKPIFYFTSANRTWKFPFLDSYVNWQQCNINIPLVFSANWSTTFGEKNIGNFNSDKTNIIEIGFIITRKPDYLKAQQFAVDNMKLVGPWGGPFSNGVSLAWVMETGLTNDFGSAGLADNDSDGFSNAAEFLAGTDPTNASSFFKIDIARNTSGKIVVKWNGNRDVNYELQEANSLQSANNFITKTNILPTTVKTEEIEVDQSGGNSKFYKVSIRPKN